MVFNVLKTNLKLYSDEITPNSVNCLTEVIKKNIIILDRNSTVLGLLYETDLLMVQNDFALTLMRHNNTVIL